MNMKIKYHKYVNTYTQTNVYINICTYNLCIMMSCIYKNFKFKYETHVCLPPNVECHFHFKKIKTFFGGKKRNENLNDIKQQRIP